jgi:acetylornithine deacetylase/succinyl-diaminopimelate desuccinylase-like protein
MCFARLTPVFRACLSLFAIAAASGSLVGPAWSAGAATAPGPTAREILKELIEINTTHKYGTTAAARALEKRFLAAGFSPADVVFAAPPEHPAEGNLVVRLRGRGQGKPVLYIGHLDVVEARREDWSFDPFKLTEQDGWLYGRGVIDMKGQDAAMAASLLRLKKEGFQPAHDLIVAFTAGEEAGAVVNGVRWLLEKHPDLIDAGLVINPDGGEAGTKAGRKLYVAVQSAEKTVLTFALEARDKGGHSSRPTPMNPIYRLSLALTRLAQLQFPVHLIDTTKLYFARRAALEQGQLRADMEAVGRGAADAGAIERLSSQVETNIMLRTTCTATMIDGGHAENALPQRARAVIQCRVIPGETPESVEETIRQSIADPSIAISVVTAANAATESPPAPDLIAEVEGIVRTMWPGVAVLPEMSPGATDSVYTRRAGLQSYGIDAMFDDLDDARAHGRDERIGIQAFAQDVEFTYTLMKQLAGGARNGR